MMKDKSALWVLLGFVMALLAHQAEAKRSTVTDVFKGTLLATTTVSAGTPVNSKPMPVLHSDDAVLGVDVSGIAGGEIVTIRTQAITSTAAPLDGTNYSDVGIATTRDFTADGKTIWPVIFPAGVESVRFQVTISAGSADVKLVGTSM